MVAVQRWGRRSTGYSDQVSTVLEVAPIAATGEAHNSRPACWASAGAWVAGTEGGRWGACRVGHKRLVPALVPAVEASDFAIVAQVHQRATGAGEA